MPFLLAGVDARPAGCDPRPAERTAAVRWGSLVADLRGTPIKPPAEQFDEFAERLHIFKKELEELLADAGLGGLDLLSYVLDRTDEPADGDSEEVSRERHLRIAGCALLEDVPRRGSGPTPSRSLDEVFESELMRPLREFFRYVEETTASYSLEDIGALVDHAGARVFKGLDTGRPFDRRVGVTLHLLLARTRGYPRP